MNSRRPVWIIVHVWRWTVICINIMAEHSSTCMFTCVWTYRWACASHHFAAPQSLSFNAQSFSFSTANWTRWTFCCLYSPTPPARSVSIYLSRTLFMLVYSPSVPVAFSLQLPTVMSLSLTRSCSLVFSVFSPTNLHPPLFRTLCIHCCWIKTCFNSAVQTNDQSSF